MLHNDHYYDYNEINYNIINNKHFIILSPSLFSGLTVSLSRDAAAAGDYALEAGALVLADQGMKRDLYDNDLYSYCKEPWHWSPLKHLR